jgi:hypothetical protein
MSKTKVRTIFTHIDVKIPKGQSAEHIQVLIQASLFEEFKDSDITNWLFSHFDTGTGVIRILFPDVVEAGFIKLTPIINRVLFRALREHHAELYITAVPEDDEDEEGLFT